MSRSRKLKKPPDELSKENAKLTQDISDLEDALHLHQRYADDDRSSVKGIIRQEVGGSRWQYGGEGKLHTFRSKGDLDEGHGVTSHRSGRGSGTRSAMTTRKAEAGPPLEAVGEKASGPRCLNEDSDIQSKALAKASSAKRPSQKSSAKQNVKSAHQQQNSWNFGPGPNKIPHNSQEYASVMKNLFGEGGFPLEKKYSVQSASVGVSLFQEKDNTDINEMKSKVLKRASAVLIMRPKSGSKKQGPSPYTQYQKCAPPPRNPKLAKGKGQKKMTEAQTAKKKLMNTVKSDPDLRLNLHSPSGKKDSGLKTRKASSTDSETDLYSPDQKNEGKIEEKTQENTESEDEDEGMKASMQNGESWRVQEKDDDVDDVLALFNQGKERDNKARHQVLLTESRNPLHQRIWDKNAVPKPWDKWSHLKDADLYLSKSEGQANGQSEKMERRTRSQSSQATSSKHVLRTSQSSPLSPKARPSTGRSWNTVSQAAPDKQVKRPQSAFQTANRHSWTGEYYRMPEAPSQPQKPPETENLPPAKQRAVAEWLDKHVNSSQEEEPKPESSSSSDAQQVGSLGEITAKAGGVDSFDSESRVAAWLASLGLKDVERYEKIFSQHQIDMMDLPSLTVPVLHHIGIAKIGPVMKIMRGVDKLRSEMDKTSVKMGHTYDYNSEKRRGDVPGAGENTLIFTPGRSRGARASRTDGDTLVRKKDSNESQALRKSTEKAAEEKTASAKERVETLRSSLQEMYRQLSTDNSSPQNGTENTLVDNSRETSPFECTGLHTEGHRSESSSNYFLANSASDASLPKTSPRANRVDWDAINLHEEGRKNSSDPFEFDRSRANNLRNYSQDPEMPDEVTIHQTVLPHGERAAPKSSVCQGRKSAKPSQSDSNESVTKATGKKKSLSSSAKVRGQGDAPQVRPTSGIMDAGVARLSQRLAYRRKKRDQEEDLREQRLQKLRQQRDAMAARHKLRERSRSVEREGLPLVSDQMSEGNIRSARRRSDSGLDQTSPYQLDSTEDLLADLAQGYDLAHRGQGQTRASVNPDLLSLQMNEMAALLQTQEPDFSPDAQGMTLSAVRQLKKKLHNYEQTLIHNNTVNPMLTPTSAAAAAGERSHISAHSGSHGDFAFDVAELGSPGAVGASGGYPESRTKAYGMEGDLEEDMRLGNQGDFESVMYSHRHPQSALRKEEEAHWPHSLSNRTGSGSRRSPSRGKSRRLPLAYRTSQRDLSANAASNFNENASVQPPPGPDKEPAASRAAAPKPIDLALQGVTVGKAGPELRTDQDTGGAGGAAVAKPHSAPPHLSMSKRQLLDEMRREKDEHRKHVRHLKSELTRLQHKDPVRKAEIERADIVFTESELIGEGAFSKVFRGSYQGAEVAVKRVKTPLSLQDKNYFAAEVTLLRDLRHPRVVLLVGVCSADRLPIMVLEFMAGRDLYTLIHNSSRPALDHAEFYQIARDVSSGMVYLHNHRPPVLHLDLKSMNVLLTSAHRAKIADFGFSKLKHDADKARKPAKNTEVKGSPAWMAPELLQGGEVTTKADVFSFGVILWEMMSRKHPYEGCSVYQILERVRTNKRPDIPSSCPPDLAELISKCWHQNPAVRPNFKEVLKQTEDLSFPPGWRALFKAAGVPNEALEDLASTREIISLVNSTLESSALSTAVEQGKAAETQASNLKSQVCSQNEEKVKATPHVRDSLETCDYSLSDDETLCLDDSLDSTLRKDSLEVVSPRSRSCSDASSTDSLKKGSEHLDGLPTLSKRRNGVLKGAEKKWGASISVRDFSNDLQSKRSRVSEVPSLPLDGLRSPTPQPVHLSMSSVYDSVEDGLNPPLSSLSGQHPPLGSNVPGRNLTPIVPRLSLGDILDDVVKVVSGSEEVVLEMPLSKRDPLAPIATGPKSERYASGEKSEAALQKASARRSEKPASYEAAEPGKSSAGAESGESSRHPGPLMSAREARRRGLSHRSLAGMDQPFTSSPRDADIDTNISHELESQEKKLQQDSVLQQPTLEADLRIDVVEASAAGSSGDGNVNNNSTVPAKKEKGKIRTRPVTSSPSPKPKDRTRLPVKVSPKGVDVPRSDRKDCGESQSPLAEACASREASKDGLKKEETDMVFRKSQADFPTTDSSAMQLEEPNSLQSLPVQTSPKTAPPALPAQPLYETAAATKMSFAIHERHQESRIPVHAAALPLTTLPPTQPPRETADDRKTSSTDKDFKRESFSAPLSANLPVTVPPPPPPPPPPPLPPPLPSFTPAGPKFSNSSAVSKQDLAKRTENLATVHKELLQGSLQQDPTKSMEKRLKKRSFLKERYRGNPHVSVEASALMEQKGQLRPATLPHPNQLQDLPAGGQAFTSMADLLRKAMGDRRFAMGENATSSNSQEFTDVSWSMQDD